MTIFTGGFQLRARLVPQVAEAPAAPIIDMVDASDTGSSSTDNITSITSPNFNVTAPDGLTAGQLLHVYNDGVEVTGSPHTITSGDIANLAAVVTMTIASPCVITWPGNLPTANTSFTLITTGALPTGLVAGTTYYVKSPSGSTSNVSATAGGSAINTSGSQSGVHTAKVAIALSLTALSQGAGQDITMKLDNGTLSTASNTETLVIDTTAPTFSSSTPADNATSVAVNTNIVLTFSENIVAGDTASFTLKKTSDNSTVVAFTEADFGGTLTISGATLTINPGDDLPGSTEVYLVWTAGSVTDFAGNAVSANASTTALSFTTEASTYVAHGVNFDGTNDYLTRGAGLTGAADSKKGIVSVWWKVGGGDGNFRQIFEGPSGDGLQVSQFFNNKFYIQGQNAASSNILTLMSDNTYVASGATWHHALASWDLATGTAQLYIDDVESADFSTTATNDTLDYTKTQWSVGARSDSSLKFNGDLADLYINFGESLDLSNSTNRRKFISAGLAPVDLGVDGSTPTGTAPIIYQHGSTASWHTNDGTGGGFTLNGTLTDAGSNPP